MTSFNGGFDRSAQDFLTATAISDATIAAAINTLVISAKANGWWYKCNVIYPFVGGTATTHKYNLKDPRDLDAAFRITFNGSWTHSSTGILPDATTTFAQTHLIPNTLYTTTESHLSYYSRTSAAGSATATEMSATTVAATDFRLIIRRSTDTFFSLINGTASQITGSTMTDGSGYFMGSRTTLTAHTLYRNGSSFASSGSSNGTTNVPAIQAYIGAANMAGTAIQFSNKECAFATIGLGISASMALLMYKDIQNFQTTLSRQV